MPLSEWDKKVVKELRELLGPIPKGITDQYILKVTKGRLFRQQIELRIAFQDCMREFESAFGEIFEEMKKLIKRLVKGIKACL